MYPNDRWFLPIRLNINIKKLSMGQVWYHKHCEGLLCPNILPFNHLLLCYFHILRYNSWKRGRDFWDTLYFDVRRMSCWYPTILPFFSCDIFFLWHFFLWHFSPFVSTMSGAWKAPNFSTFTRLFCFIIQIDFCFHKTIFDDL